MYMSVPLDPLIKFLLAFSPSALFSLASSVAPCSFYTPAGNVLLSLSRTRTRNVPIDDAIRNLQFRVHMLI